LQNAIDANKVMIFSKSYCPFCRRAKELIATEYPDVQKEIFELDEREDGDAIQSYLLEKTGQRTVPNIFVGKQHVGGCDAVTAAFEAGKLTPMIKAWCVAFFLHRSWMLTFPQTHVTCSNVQAATYQE
ncbi:glutaredoxin, partial [Fistulina hepatica ATCC 64428]